MRFIVEYGLERANIKMPHTLTPELAAAAISGFEAQKKRIDAQIAELRSMLDAGQSKVATETEVPTGKRKNFSAATRRKMALAQKARWAKIKGESEPAQAAASKPKRKMSAAGRRAISIATKKRWALKKAEAAKGEPTVVKRAGRKKAAKTGRA
jgi:hypothetical protein